MDDDDDDDDDNNNNNNNNHGVYIRYIRTVIHIDRSRIRYYVSNSALHQELILIDDIGMTLCTLYIPKFGSKGP